jgi:hypothetical protein
MNDDQVNGLVDLIKSNAEKISKQGQGNCTIHNDLYDEVKSIYPELTSLSANYYDCEGTIAFALKISPLFNYDGENYFGFATSCPRGHLTKYYKIRIKI